MPSRVSEQRHKGNVEQLRELVNSGSLSIVRDPVDGVAISGNRRKYALPGIGYRSGKLTVTGYIKGLRGGVSALIVMCDCNNEEYTLDQQNFKSFRSTRCNLCAKKASTKTRKLYWGYSDILPDDAHRERLLNRISSCISRCHSTSNVHKDYGGRGIEVFQPWRENRGEFLKYLITLDNWQDPSRDIDRVDNNRGYEPGNLRFATRSENAKNRRKVKIMQTELDDLRHRLRRAEEQIHNCDGCRAAYSP